jgi:hypothetical protein
MSAVALSTTTIGVADSVINSPINLLGIKISTGIKFQINNTKA